MFITRREFYLCLDYEELDEFFKEAKLSIAKKNILKDYTVNVYKDQVVCCGIFSIGVAIEIEGPNEQQVKDLDMMTHSKIIEICERKGIDNHESRPLEILTLAEDKE